MQSIDASKIAYNSTTLDNLAVAASGNGAALVPFLHSVTGAVARNTQDRMQDWVSALDFMTSA